MTEHEVAVDAVQTDAPAALARILGTGRVPLDSSAEYDLRHDDYVMEIPQSGERIRGRDRMRAMQEAFPAPPAMTVRRVTGDRHLWVVELTSDYDGEIYHVADIIEFRGGKVFRETRYYAQPFEPPLWRAHLVEQM